MINTHPLVFLVLALVIAALVAAVIEQWFKLRAVFGAIDTHRDWLRVRWARAWNEADARELETQRDVFDRHFAGYTDK